MGGYAKTQKKIEGLKGPKARLEIALIAAHIALAAGPAACEMKKRVKK